MPIPTNPGTSNCFSPPLAGGVVDSDHLALLCRFAVNISCPGYFLLRQYPRCMRLILGSSTTGCIPFRLSFASETHTYIWGIFPFEAPPVSVMDSSTDTTPLPPTPSLQ